MDDFASNRNHAPNNLGIPERNARRPIAVIPVPPYNGFMTKDLRLSTSLEDYLEAILNLERTQRVARVKDIADLLGVKMPSVTAAMKSLRDRDLINYERNSYISLTDNGLQAAESVRRRHRILRSFLQNVLLLSPEEAQEQACRIEHSIDAVTADRIAACTRYLDERVIGKIGPEAWEEIIDPGHEDI